MDDLDNVPSEAVAIAAKRTILERRIAWKYGNRTSSAIAIMYRGMTGKNI